MYHIPFSYLVIHLSLFEMSCLHCIPSLFCRILVYFNGPLFVVILLISFCKVFSQMETFPEVLGRAWRNIENDITVSLNRMVSLCEFSFSFILLWLSYQIWARCNAGLSRVIHIKISLYMWDLIKLQTITELLRTHIFGFSCRPRNVLSSVISSPILFLQCATSKWVLDKNYLHIVQKWTKNSVHGTWNPDIDLAVARRVKLWLLNASLFFATPHQLTKFT